MGIERDFLRQSGGFGGGEGHRQDGIGTQLGFVVGTICLDHQTIEFTLVSDILAQQQAANGAVDIANGGQHPLAQVAALVAVAQFQGFP